jgi:predicted transposase YdaD
MKKHLPAEIFIRKFNNKSILFLFRRLLSSLVTNYKVHVKWHTKQKGMKERREEGRNEGRKQGKNEERKEGRKELRKEGREKVSAC